MRDMGWCEVAELGFGQLVYELLFLLNVKDWHTRGGWAGFL